MGRLHDYILEQSQKKGKTPDDWLMGTVDNCQKCHMATHVGKFTSPFTKVVLMDSSKSEREDVVLTSNTNSVADIVYSSAAYMGAAKFLLMPMEDGRTVLYHLVNQTQAIKKEVESFNIPFQDLCEMACQVQSALIPSETDGKLKQVYFPIAPGEYHLLTILPASALLETLNIRIRKLRQKMWKCRKEKGESGEQEFSSLPNCVTIAFGGTKPQNISALNSEMGGKAYLLPSLPPWLISKSVRYPHRDFFYESIPQKECDPHLKHLDTLFKTGWNNLKIREGIQRTVDSIVDLVLGYASILQDDEGWIGRMGRKKLPKGQTIWLDKKYESERAMEPWIDEVSTQFSRWLIHLYGKRIPDGIALGDAEMNFLKARMQKVLEVEVRYGQ